jgi:2-keto-3-deoxy-L-rhamnonate aldolase
MAPSIPVRGVYTPLVIFFHEDESLDLESTKLHVQRIVSGGVSGVVLQGSNGEAPHLTHVERKLLVRTIRYHLNSINHPETQLVVGCGGPSVRETLIYISEAEDAGADFALVLPPAYWVSAMTPAILEGFFGAVADESPLPILIYNFPGVTGGIDISSDTVLRLAKAHSNIVGVKLTCGNVGKLQRISSGIPTGTFAPFGGKSDFFLPALLAGSHGVIAALANVAPKAHVTLLKLYTNGDLKAAQELQVKLSNADWALSKVGVTGVKAVVAHSFGYGTGRGRRPLRATSLADIGAEVLGPIQEVIELEKAL